MPPKKATPPKKPVKPTATPTSDQKDRKVFANRYEVHNKLGAGNFGTAYLVKDLHAKTAVDEWKVAKEMSLGHVMPDETVDAMHEARLMSKLNHPGVVKFYDSFLAGEVFLIITEYCDGGDLKVKITDAKKKNTPFSEETILMWFCQLMMAVEFLHSRKVLHRDLGSGNVFLKNNMIKVGDFGISRVLMGTCDMASTFTGTPYYMSPEVLKHTGYNNKSDVWSCGCILYELCALGHAFEGQGLMGVMYKIVEGELPSIPDTYSREMDGVLKAILVRDADQRPTAGDVLALPLINNGVKQMQLTMQEHLGKVGSGNAEKESAELYDLIKQPSHMEDLQNSLPMASVYTPPTQSEVDQIRAAEEEIMSTFKREKTSFRPIQETSEQLRSSEEDAGGTVKPAKPKVARTPTQQRKQVPVANASPKARPTPVNVKSPVRSSPPRQDDDTDEEDLGATVSPSLTIEQLQGMAAAGERLTPRQQLQLRKHAQAQAKAAQLREITKETYTTQRRMHETVKSLHRGGVAPSPSHTISSSNPASHQMAQQRRLADSPDDRRLSPMKKDFYTKHTNELNFSEDGIPVNAVVAEQYYSGYGFHSDSDEEQPPSRGRGAPSRSHRGGGGVGELRHSTRYFDQDVSDSPGDSGYNGGTIRMAKEASREPRVQFESGEPDVRMFGDSGDEAAYFGEDDNAEEEHLMQYMQSVLSRHSKPQVERTFVNDNQSAYGPWAKQQKITNLTRQCEARLGEHKLNAAMNYLKSARGLSDAAISHSLAAIIGNDAPTQFLLEQLVFLQDT